MNLHFLLLVAILTCPILSKAQYINDVLPDSMLNQHLQIIEKITDNYLDNPNRFVTGKLYYPRGIKDNHPFFIDYNWKSGWIEFQKQKYPVQMIKYDIEKDALIMMKTIGTMGYSIQLSDQVIQRFAIDGRQFAYLDSMKIKGYYEEVYRGKTIVWARWKKTDANPIRGTPRYAGSVQFLILKDGTYYKARSLGNIYEIFPDREKELKDFKRRSKLSFRNNTTNTIRLLVEHYDALNK